MATCPILYSVKTANCWTCWSRAAHPPAVVHTPSYPDDTGKWSPGMSYYGLPYADRGTGGREQACGWAPAAATGDPEVSTVGGTIRLDAQITHHLRGIDRTLRFSAATALLGSLAAARHPAFGIAAVLMACVLRGASDTLDRATGIGQRVPLALVVALSGLTIGSVLWWRGNAMANGCRSSYSCRRRSNGYGNSCKPRHGAP